MMPNIGDNFGAYWHLDNQYSPVAITSIDENEKLTVDAMKDVKKIPWTLTKEYGNIILSMILSTL